MSEESSHRQILRTTSIVGGSQIVIILIGVIRTKLLAVLLGPAGVGLAGLFQSVISLINTATSLGIGFSAVRDIAQAAGTNDEKKISRSITVLRRWVLFTGTIGALVAIFFSKSISKYTFGNTNFASAITWLSISVFLGIISSGQLALLQGLQQINSRSKANVFAAVIGLIVSVPLFWYLGQAGIIPSLIIASFTTFFLAWWYSRKIKIIPIKLSIRETYWEGKKMVHLGMITVISGLVDVSVMYLVRAYVSQRSSIEGVGHFTAAWTISNMYISAVFTAMAADYYPRLSRVQSDKVKLSKIVNEQTEVALLIACPIIIGMISFISILIPLLYSSKFGNASNILVWQLAGDFFKVLAWPLGFVFLANGKGREYVLTNISWSCFYLFFVYTGWSSWGIEATGIAFALAYLLLLLLCYFLLRPLIGFSWSHNANLYIGIFLPLVIIACCSSLLLSGKLQYFIGFLVTVSAMVFSFIHLKNLVDVSLFWSRLKRR